MSAKTSENVFGPQRKNPDEIMRDFNNTPLFMDSLPEDFHDNDALSALQTLFFTGDSLGNECFQSGRSGFKDALEFYSKGIAAKAENSELNSVLYSNRAAVHLEMQNYRSVLNDCSKAINFNPKNVKAYFRSAKALLFLDRAEEALDCIEYGLHIDSTNGALLAEKNKATKRAEELKFRDKKREEKLRIQIEEKLVLIAEIKSRGIKLVDSAFLKDEPTPTKNKPTTIDQNYINILEKMKTMTIGRSVYSPGFEPKIELDTEKLLNLPVLFLYPEYAQHDSIAQFNEKDTFLDHLSVMFDDPENRPAWDNNGKYISENLEVYFEKLPKALDIISVLETGNALDGVKKSKILKVGKKLPLGNVVSHKDFVMVDGTAVFFVLVAGSKFEVEFKIGVLEKWRKVKLFEAEQRRTTKPKLTRILKSLSDKSTMSAQQSISGLSHVRSGNFYFPQVAADDSFISDSKWSTLQKQQQLLLHQQMAVAQKSQPDFSYNHQRLYQQQQQQQLQQVQLQKQQQQKSQFLAPSNPANKTSHNRAISIGNDFNSGSADQYGNSTHSTLPSNSKNVVSGNLSVLNKVPQASAADFDPLEKVNQDALLITILNHQTVSPELAHFVACLIYAIWHKAPFVGAVAAPTENVKAFARFCEEILKTTALSFSVLLLALKFIQRLKTCNPLLKGSEGSECRILVCALMLSMKVLMDNTYTNRTWNKVSKIPIEELNVMEVEFLVQLHFDLYVSEKDYYIWLQEVDLAVREFKSISVSKRSSEKNRLSAIPNQNGQFKENDAQPVPPPRKGSLSYTQTLFDSSILEKSAASLNGSTLARPRANTSTAYTDREAKPKVSHPNEIFSNSRSSGHHLFVDPNVVLESIPIKNISKKSQRSLEKQNSMAQNQSASRQMQGQSNQAYYRQNGIMVSNSAGLMIPSSIRPNPLSPAQVRPTSALYSGFAMNSDNQHFYPIPQHPNRSESPLHSAGSNGLPVLQFNQQRPANQIQNQNVQNQQYQVNDYYGNSKQSPTSQPPRRYESLHPPMPSQSPGSRPQDRSSPLPHLSNHVHSPFSSQNDLLQPGRHTPQPTTPQTYATDANHRPSFIMNQNDKSPAMGVWAQLSQSIPRSQGKKEKEGH
ncbi:hypothetical protein HK096_000552 [Nowakowskiella sp. JEL0078]|nr:hypothetical protein HK096_000552 [Nowakowskiella sp. JEL0078]